MRWPWAQNAILWKIINYTRTNGYLCGVCRARAQVVHELKQANRQLRAETEYFFCYRADDIDLISLTESELMHRYHAEMAWVRSCEMAAKQHARLVERISVRLAQITAEKGGTVGK